jgi:hypothetical protein
LSFLGLFPLNGNNPTPGGEYELVLYAICWNIRIIFNATRIGSLPCGCKYAVHGVERYQGAAHQSRTSQWMIADDAVLLVTVCLQ